jgi:hypothetical protein
LVVIAIVGCGRVVENVPDAASIVDAAMDVEKSALIEACDRYYDAELNRCFGPRLPADEDAREKARFEQVCANEVALAGSGVTPAALDACSDALAQSECSGPYGPPRECDIRGTLQAGDACTDNVQCASGA